VKRAMVKKAPNPVDKHVGGRVRMRRMMLDMSQEKLGDALGLTFQQVQKYENGANRVSASRLQHISDILGVPVPFFFEGAPHVPGQIKSKGAAPSPAYVTEFLASSRRSRGSRNPSYGAMTRLSHARASGPRFVHLAQKVPFENNFAEQGNRIQSSALYPCLRGGGQKRICVS
jgi:transcriptional regulator with XRE-family HTH domain